MNSINHEGNTYSMVYGDAYMGMFKYRAMLYGENFWETLRYFYAGVVFLFLVMFGAKNII
jgi:hypothetical protein